MSPDLLHRVAREISDAGFLKLLFPALAVAGPLFLLYYGHRGITKRETIMLFRGRNQGVSEAAGRIEGTAAVVFGVAYVVVGLSCAGIMLPIAGAMLGLW